MFGLFCLQLPCILPLFLRTMKRVLLLIILIPCMLACHLGNNPWITPFASFEINKHPVGGAAMALTKGAYVTYDASYQRLDYPKGDVPADRGVCADVVIRALRLCGYDLQQLIHEDMRNHFSSYPGKWGLSRPDPNIDHRRVPNLMVFF